MIEKYCLSKYCWTVNTEIYIRALVNLTSLYLKCHFLSIGNVGGSVF